MASVTNEEESKKPSFEKRFVLRHVFKDVIDLEEDQVIDSEWEDHFSVNWRMSVERRNNHFGFFVHCEPIAQTDKWSIETELKIKIGRNRKNFFKRLTYHYGESSEYRFHAFLEWEKIRKEYLVNGNLSVEAKVTIVDTAGLEKEKIRTFDESQRNVSDVIIVVRSTKFFVLKMYLASQSSFFKSLFIENRSVFNKREIALPGIEPNDFQYFLEVLYGESAIDDSTVEGVLLLADEFDSSIVKRKCKEFLLEKSKKSFDTKQKLANRYHLEDWNFTCAIASANSKIKQFTIKHVFKNSMNFKEGMDSFSERGEHYNVYWDMNVVRLNKYLGFYIHCEPIAPSDKWSIQTNIELKVVGRNHNDVIKTFDYCYEKSEGWGFPKYLEWEKLEKQYLIDGNLTVESKVTIFETTGLGKAKIRKFDKSQKNVSDVILVVRDTKFHVLQTHLVDRSKFFEALFSENSLKSNKSEVSLTGGDPYDFHYFLEVLYGDYAIDDSTIEGILMVADKYDTPMVIRRCHHYLLNSSEKSLKKKLELSAKYGLTELKTQCMSGIKTIADIRAVRNVHEMDHSITADLLEKSLSLQ